MMRVLNTLIVAEKEISRATLSVIERLLGPAAAVTYFAWSPVVRRTPARLSFLCDIIRRRRGEAAGAAAALRLLSGAPRASWYALLLPPHPGAPGIAAPGIAALEAPLPALIRAARRRPDRAAALVIALLQREETVLAARVLESARGGPGGSAAAAALAPACIRPLSAPPPKDFAALTLDDIAPGPARNRLLALDPGTSMATICALAQGAQKVTVMVFGDLFGKIDFDTLRAALPGTQITVEHGRTRTDRFTPRYHALHRGAAAAADALIAEAAGLIGRLAPPGVAAQALLPTLALEVADLIFFAALRADGVLTAMRDPAFDDIILCFGREWRFYRLAFADPGLAADPRVRACCRALEQGVRRRHFQRLADVRAVAQSSGRHSTPPVCNAQKLTRDERLVADYLAKVGRPGRTGGRYAPDAAPIALVSGQERAYVADVAAMAVALHRTFNVDVVWARGGRVTQFADRLRDSAEMAGATARPGLVRGDAGAAPRTVATAFANLLKAPFADAVASAETWSADDAAIRMAIRSEVDGPLSAVMLAALTRLRKGAALLRAHRYRAIAICPARSSANLQFAALARLMNTPSIAIEPHCLNASYCRYAAIPMDAAVVPLDYFALEYGRFFGMPRARCHAIGSPRIHPPPGYDSAAARRCARARLGFSDDDPPIILLPTQPMPEAFALPVWRMIVRAAQSLDRPVQVLLKLHPEEGAARQARYEAIAEAEGASALCRVVDADIKDLIAASAVVVVCYSTTALEAAALDRPVIVAGNPATAYPVPYDEILGAPLCMTPEEMAAAMRDALADGADTRARMTAFRAANPYIFDQGYHDRLAGTIRLLIAQGPAAIRPLESLPRDPFVTAPFKSYFAETAP